MEELKRRRIRARAKLARIEAFAEQAVATAANTTDVHMRLELLSDIWNEFDNIQTQIECACSDDELTMEQEEQNQFETKFFAVKATLMNLPNVVSERAHSTTTNATTESHTSPRMQGQGAHIKLPTIDLPTFSGQYQNWTAFSDLFKAVIHDNNQLSSVQKLHYLKSSLKGDAARVLNSVAITESNYMEAWSILTDRYSNRRQIIQSHLKALHAQPRLTTESAKDIRMLVDTTVENIRALHAIGLPTEHWDHLTTFLITERLDNSTRRQWELIVTDNNDSSSFNDLKIFLERRCRALESATTEKRPIPIKFVPHLNKHQSTAVAYHTLSPNCIKCHADHPLYKCESFLGTSVQERTELVKKSSLCLNCLRPGHNCKACKSSTCRKCGKFHNTLLHKERDNTIPTSTSASNATSYILEDGGAHQIILATARLQVTNKHGTKLTLRALLDSGSQATFITESIAKKLQLPRTKSNLLITGLGSTGVGQCKGMIQIQVNSMCSSFECQLKAYILNQLTEVMPAKPIDNKASSTTIDKHKISLADPNYDTPGPIDILIGADSYYDLLMPGKIRDNQSNLILQSTVLGWIVAGPTIPKTNTLGCLSHLAVQDLNSQLQDFWEIEETPQGRTHTSEEVECMNHFANTYTRTASGRFIVKLPFKDTLNEIGETRNIAQRRLLQMERRLASDSVNQHEYHKFMKEYEELNHMKLVKSAESSLVKYHMPHHYVIRQHTMTTKLRVVFDGSATPDVGLALNNVLMVGPQLQDELFTIITRFRIHNIVYTADIEKMYRQILVHPDDCQYQGILWRHARSEPIQEYQLTTLTYGTASAPFLAIRCLHELAHLEKDKYPLAAEILKRDLYVDDILSGSNTIEEAIETQSQLINILKNGGFQLHKWSTNHPTFLSTLPTDK